ncbi:MAG: diphthine synthase [Candidatus Nezhaarchaeota archaeon]|nr:diphthine synthase [Candidatus Nezhaarchaeota archaeon]MCX8142128.1 diphthine synthase [Candidatus Nezhaarchaeota archaeon]MDW8050091.1 diphthine synthase [Nitrososphaerota archaeon]
MGLTFVGIGLTESGLTIEGLREALCADYIFIDTYTSILPEEALDTLSSLIGKKIIALKRVDLEGRGMERIIDLARESKVVLLVAGDPFIATTHVSLKVEAAKAGVLVKYIPSASIQTVIPGLTGLSSYKLSKSATIVFPDKGSNITAYETVKENKSRGLHTILYLDIDVENSRAMTINEGVKILLELENERGEGVISSETLMIGIARACWRDSVIKAAKPHKLLSYDFGPPPHVLVVPGQLHFMELEALKIFANMEDP